MFTDFLYFLRNEYGQNVSVQEWLTLLKALQLGLHDASFTGFYELCRMILVKRESELDPFDRAFLDYFGSIAERDQVPEQFLQWLEHPNIQNAGLYRQLLAKANLAYSNEDVAKMFRERLATQKEEHNLGNFFVGTGGVSPFGQGGYSPKGIRVSGESRFRNAFAVAGKRTFRDFREDCVLDTRQMQMAFRRLRQYSGREDVPETEFSLEKTVQATCRNAGQLKIQYEKPRKNTIKLLLLMDSGGSMYHYGKLCSGLFQAVHQANHFKDLKIYYFHNCVYERLYYDPLIQDQTSVSTDWVLKQYTPDYRVIFVGDAQMNPDELLQNSFFSFSRYGVNKIPGIQWLRRFRDRYEHIVWLNPEERPTGGKFWTRSYDAISELFGGMYQLTLSGLDAALKKLLVNTGK